METAVVLSEYGPLCFNCAEDLLERWIAAELSPELARTLPSLGFK